MEKIVSFPKVKTLIGGVGAGVGGGWVKSHRGGGYQSMSIS